MPLEQIPLVGLVLLLGTIIQGSVGFGLGMFSIPLLVWSGATLPQAIGFMIPTVICQTSLNVWQHRDSLPVRDVVPMLVYRSITLPLGVLMLSHIATLDMARAKQILGATLLGVLCTIWLVRPQPRPTVSGWWTLLAGTISGFSAGTVGMGGPPVTLWVLAHDWPAVRQRAFLWISFLTVMPLHASLLIWKFGQPLLDAMSLAVFLTPLALVGAWIGGRIGARLDRQRLRQAILFILFVIAVRSLWAS